MAQETNAAVVVENNAPQKGKYKIVGLKKEDKMPIEHGGVMYDLANLSEEQVDTLITGKCTYVVKG